MVISWGIPESLLKLLLASLGGRLERGAFAEAHEVVLFPGEINWCRKIVSVQTVSHDP